MGGDLFTVHTQAYRLGQNQVSSTPPFGKRKEQRNKARLTSEEAEVGSVVSAGGSESECGMRVRRLIW